MKFDKFKNLWKEYFLFNKMAMIKQRQSHRFEFLQNKINKMRSGSGKKRHNQTFLETKQISEVYIQYFSLENNKHFVGCIIQLSVSLQYLCIFKRSSVLH